MDKTDHISTWIHCPVCTRKTRTKVYMDTILINYPLYCPKCKREFLINVVQQKMVVNKDIDL